MLLRCSQAWRRLVNLDERKDKERTEKERKGKEGVMPHWMVSLLPYPVEDVLCHGVTGQCRVSLDRVRGCSKVLGVAGQCWGS